MIEAQAHASLRATWAAVVPGAWLGSGAAIVEAVAAGPAPGEPRLAEVRAATERFRSVEVVLAASYLRDPMDVCETAPMMGRPAELGAMGIHFFRPDLLGLVESASGRIDGIGTHTDFLEPAILIYEPEEDGSLELVAVENLVFAAAWRETGHAVPPSFHGVTFDTMIDDPATPVDEAHMFEPHHDLHVWLFRHNPHGMFVSFNPAVTCERHQRAPEPAAGHAGSHQAPNSIDPSIC
jgi:hypothetical protein